MAHFIDARLLIRSCFRTGAPSSGTAAGAPNPPRYVVSVVHGSDEYMVGVACTEHKQAVSRKVGSLQAERRVPAGTIRFTALKPVGTDCIRADPDETIQITGLAGTGRDKEAD